VGVVWYGYDDPKPLPSNTWNSSLLIWKNVMEQVHKNLPVKEFDMPTGITVNIPICTVSGKKATNLCYKDVDGNKVKLELYKKTPKRSTLFFFPSKKIYKLEPKR
jgi:penicillin-binding protein 1A